MWTRRYAKRTIESYLYWIKAYIIFIGKTHPNDCYDKEVEQFISYLSNNLNLIPKSQALTLNSVNYIYKHILVKPLNLELRFNKSRVTPKLPTVLTTAEVKAFLRLPVTNVWQWLALNGSGTFVDSRYQF
jgi:site-specific recombinase XerD